MKKITYRQVNIVPGKGKTLSQEEIRIRIEECSRLLSFFSNLLPFKKAKRSKVSKRTQAYEQ